MLSLFLAVVTIARAQTEFKKVQYGISVIPHLGTLLNGDGHGKGLASFGYGIELGIHKPVSKNLMIHSGIYFQKSTLKQRFNNFRWPDDHENGEWVRGRSHEQYEVEYSAIGFTAGVNVKLTQNENFWSLVGSGSVRKVLDEKDKLIINESGSFREYNSGEIETELNKTQFGIAGGLRYNVSLVSGKNRLYVGPSFEYVLTNLLKSNIGTYFWSFEGGKPFFIYLKAGYFFI